MKDMRVSIQEFLERGEIFLDHGKGMLWNVQLLLFLWPAKKIRKA